MDSQPWVIGTLLTSIVLIVFTIIKLKTHPFLVLLLVSFYVGALMGLNPVGMVSAIDGVAGGMLFVEVGVVVLIPLVFFIVVKTNTSLLKLAIPLCTALLMAIHCIILLRPAVFQKFLGSILLIIGAGGAFNGILKASGLSDTLVVILSGLDMYPIILSWLVAIISHAAVSLVTVAMMDATAIVSPILPLYSDIGPEIITLAISSGAIGYTIVTDTRCFGWLSIIVAQCSVKFLNTIQPQHLLHLLLRWLRHFSFLPSCNWRD